MRRPPATSRKLRRVLVLLALFLTCQQATQTARALLGAGAVPFPRSVPAGIWARSLLVARRAEADGTLDGGEAVPSQTAETVEDAKQGITGKKASSAKYEVEEVEEATTQAKAGFDQAEWLQKTAEEIKKFGVDEVRDWAKAVLKAKNLDEEKAEAAAQRLEEEEVVGELLISVTPEKLASAYNMKRGPANLLVNQLRACWGGAPPMAASGFQDDPDATAFIRELANAKPQDLGAGVQVFNLTKSLPVEPYSESGPKLLTRNTTRRAWKATFELMKNNTKRVAMLGVPGIGKSRNLALGLWHLVTGQLPDGIPQPEAIVYEAREGGAVFLFTKGQDGWKAQSKSILTWDAAASPYLKKPNNWYLVDASETKTSTLKLFAKTVIACSPDPKHYSQLVKSGECVFVEAFRWAEVEACYPHFKTQVDQEEMRQRFLQVGGALRTLLANDAGYTRALQLQRADAQDFATVERAFEGDLSTFEEKKMPTRLFTHLSADGIFNNVTVCSPGAATLLVDEHYDKLVDLWNAGKPESRYVLEECVGPLLTTFWPGKQGFTAFEVTNAAQAAGKRAQWNRTPVNDFQLKEGLQLLECDTDQIFNDRWRKAVQKGSLEGRVLHSPENYPGIDYLLDFNHGISVTTSLKHDIAKAFREKLVEMFGKISQPCSFTLTFLITGEPHKFTPNRSDYTALMDMPEKLFDNVRVQVVQIPKTRNSLSRKLRCGEIRVVFAALAVTFVLLLGILKLSGGGSSRPMAEALE